MPVIELVIERDTKNRIYRALRYSKHNARQVQL